MHPRHKVARPLPKPTTAEPGTPEKIAAMRRRLRMGQHLFHPDDAPMSDGWAEARLETQFTEDGITESYR